MFIAHIPAGYILTTKLQKSFHYKKGLLLGLLASVFPDIDIFYFYLVDQRQHGHHSYWTHLPFYWVIFTFITLAALYVAKKKQYIPLAIIFFSNIFGHFILDTVVGKINWLYPFSDQSFALFEVPNQYDFWVFNFIFHWTFGFEIAIMGYALWVFIKEKRKPIHTSNHTIS